MDVLCEIELFTFKAEKVTNIVSLWKGHLHLEEIMRHRLSIMAELGFGCSGAMFASFLSQKKKSYPC